MMSPSGRALAVLAAFALALNSGGASVAAAGAVTLARGDSPPAASTRSAPPANGSWTQLSSGLNNNVFSIVKGRDDTIYFAGGFSNNNAGLTLNSIAAWSPSGQTFAPLGNGLNGTITDMVMSRDDTLYFGGFFTSAVGGPALARVGAWSARTQSYSAVGSGVSSYVTSLALRDDTLYLSGDFSTYGGGPANYLPKVAHWGPIIKASGFKPAP